MIIKITLGSWRFTYSIAPVTHIIGVDSTLPDNQHILMWDFDHIDYWMIHDALLATQQVYDLPRIYIIQTSPQQGFHAWCFKSVSWRKCVEILAYTKHLDWNYFKYGVYRGHFTLRVSSKCGRKNKLKYILESKVKEDVFVHDLKHWVNYETLADTHKSRKIELQVGVNEQSRLIIGKDSKTE